MAHLVKELIDAAINGDLGEVREKLQQGADINGERGPGHYKSLYRRGPALHAAVGHKELAVARELIQSGANLNQVRCQSDPSEAGTPLMIACERAALYDGPLEMVKLLLEHGACIETPAVVVEWPTYDDGPAMLRTAPDLLRLFRSKADGAQALQIQACEATISEARRSRAFAHWRRVAPVVGRWRIFLMRTFEEVHFRPAHEGAKRCLHDLEQNARSSRARYGDAADDNA